MKKILLSVAFVVATLTSANAQQTISQNTDPSTVVEGGGVGCPTFPNNYSRSYVLSDYGITSDWTVTEVEFGMQTYTAGDEVTITLSTTSQTYPGGYPSSLTQLYTETFTWNEDGDFILKVVPITPTVVPAGSEVVVEISGSIWCGGNSLGNTAPTYLWATACGLSSPASVADIDFADAHIIINLTGESDANTENFSSSTFSVYPNPVKDVLNISNSMNAEINTVTVVDINGRTVKQFGSVSQINVSDLNAGVYFVNINSNEGSTTKKIVKQ